jgi:WD40 repeat protein
MKHNPYVGPRPYERSDRQNFYGRNREARDLLALILSERVVLFYAQSGAGKTSLLNAQIIPALEDEGFHVFPTVRVSSDPPPGVDPAAVRNIFVFSALLGLAGAETPPEQLLDSTLRSFLESAGCSTAPAGEPGGCPPLIIFDQFEELFTTHRDRWQEAEGFFEQAAEALDALPHLGIVFTMREDYIAEVDHYAALLPYRLHARFRMERLGVGGALEAVKKPAQNAGTPFAPGVAEQLVDDLRRIKVARVTPTGLEESEVLGPYIEPVQLQVVCSRLWENLPEQPDRQIQWAEVEQYGNLDRALTEFYESTLQQVMAQTKVSERQLRHWFTEQLITPMRTRGLALRGPETTAGLPNAAVDGLEQRHLIRGDVRGGARWYELVHDRLIDPIRYANRDWEAARQTPLRLAARQWQTTHSPVLLYREQALREALAWMAANPDEVEPYEQEFLAVSQRAEQVRQRVRRLRLAATLMALGVFVVVTFLAWLAARGNLQVYSRELAAKALYMRASSQEQSVRLAREAILEQHIDPLLQRSRPLLGQIETTEAQLVLRQTLTDFYPLRLSYDTRQNVNAVLYSPDGHWLYAGLAQGGVKVWETTENQPRPALPAPGPEGAGAIWSLDLSRDGRLLAIGGDDGVKGGGIVGLWDTVAGRWAVKLQVPTDEKTFDEVYSVALSPGGQLLATGGDYGPLWRNVESGNDRGLVRLWTLGPYNGQTLTAQPVLTLTEPLARVRRVAFDRTGRYLAAASDDKTVRLWEIQQIAGVVTATPLYTLTAHTDAVNAVVFSPRATLLATASADKTIRLWDLTTGQALVTFVGHTASVSALTFSADGNYLISGSRDRTIRVWNVAARSPNAVLVLGGPTNVVLTVALHPNQTALAAGSGDSLVRVWDLDFPRRHRLSTLSGHTARLRGIAFSPDGQTLASSDNNGQVRIWDLDSGQTVRAWDALSKIWNLVYNQEGSLLVTCSADTKARVWEPTTGRLLQELVGHANEVEDAAFSPDDRYLVTVADDRLGIVWDTTTWHSVAVLDTGGLTGEVYAVAFSPDGQQVATAHTDRQARLWSFAPQAGGGVDVTLVATLTGHTDMLFDIKFSPDGRYVATASWDNTVRLWDTHTYTTVGAPLEHPGYVYSVAFSPDGRTLATGARDGYVRLWDLSEFPRQQPRLIALLGGHADLIWSVAISPDGKYVASGSWDTTIRRYLSNFDDVWALSWEAVPSQGDKTTLTSGLIGGP